MTRAALWFSMRFYLRFLRRHWAGLPAATSEDLSRRVTVVIPAVEKDLDILPHCIVGVRNHLLHRLGGLWVVAPESERIRMLVAAHGAEWVHEDTLLPRPASELKTRGWVLQQMIKLNAAEFVSDSDYLVLDADTVFLQPQVFFRGGKAVLRYSDQYELLYNRSLHLVFGHTQRFPVSFVTHHALFQRDRVRALLKQIETRFELPWWQAILQVLDEGHPVSFSEYELYGNFVVRQPGWRREFLLEYWGGVDRVGEDVLELDSIRARAGRNVNSVSFHRHTQ